MNKNFANREVCDLVLVDYTTKKPFMVLDYANVTSTEVTGEQVYAYGGQGHPKRISFYGEKGGTLTIETQIQTMQLYSLLSGANIQTGANFIKRLEVKAGSGDKLNVPDQPDAGSIVVYAANDDCGTPINGTFTATAGTTGYDITATPSSTIVENTDYIVYYTYNIANVQKLNITSKVFPKAFTAYGDTVMKTEGEEFVSYKFIAYKCAPQQTFSMSFSNTGDPTSVSITCDLLVDDDNNLMDMILDDSELTTEGGGSAAATVTGLTVTSVAGSSSGKTAVAVNPVNGSATYRYKVADTAAAIAFPAYGDTASSWGDGAFTVGTDVTAATNKYIGIVELDSNSKAVRGGVARVTAAS